MISTSWTSIKVKCPGYTIVSDNWNVKVHSNHPETAKVGSIMLTACMDLCLPTLDASDCAISYIPVDAGNPDGPGECMYYTGNCGGLCTEEAASPSVVRVLTCASAVDCGLPVTPTNGAVDTSSGTLEGNVATYTCNTGYNLVGSPTTICGADSLWTNPAPTCTIIDCGAPINPTNGVATLVSGTVYGNVVGYTCNTGYTLTGSTAATCGANGLWSNPPPTCTIIDCGVPTSPANGVATLVSGTVYGNTVDYTCDAGYTLIGATFASCGTNGQWSPATPTCVIIDCGLPVTPTNGVVNTPSGTLEGNVATYTCNTGYNLVGSPTTTCGADSLWTNSAPTCNIIDCGAPASPANGVATLVSGTVFGNTVGYTCNTGYILNGVTSASCDTNGLWYPAAPTCDIIDCGNPGVGANGQVSTASGTTYLQVASYVCDTGYILTGAATRTCQTSGLWDATVPSCDPVDCGQPATPINGTVTFPFGTTYGQAAVYTCNYGHELQGSTTRTCLATGNWDGTVPTCPDIRSVQCQALTQNSYSTALMDRSTESVLPNVSLLFSVSRVKSKISCIRKCTRHLREYCNQPNPCLFARYDDVMSLCDLYHSDAFGNNVTCTATSQCYQYEYYMYF